MELEFHRFVCRGVYWLLKLRAVSSMSNAVRNDEATHFFRLVVVDVISTEVFHVSCNSQLNAWRFNGSHAMFFSRVSPSSSLSFALLSWRVLEIDGVSLAFVDLI